MAGRRAWCAVGVLLLLPALLLSGHPLAGAALDWQPQLALTEPWRAWSAAWVHLSRLHLVANLAGGVLVIALGVAARVQARAALAWLLAWPLTQFGLLWMPALTHYAGLSGVLHAGVAVVAVTLMLRPARGQWLLGAAIAAVLVVKVIAEAPPHGPISHPAGWDIAVAPAAHVSGAVAGALITLLLWVPLRKSSKAGGATVPP